MVQVVNNDVKYYVCLDIIVRKENDLIKLRRGGLNLVLKLFLKNLLSLDSLTTYTENAIISKIKIDSRIGCTKTKTI